VNEEGVEERSRPVGHPGKGESSEDGGQGLNFRLPDVRQGEGDGLQPQGVGPELAGIGEQNKSAEEEFPPEQVNKRIPRQTADLRSIVILHRAAVSGKPKDRSDQKDREARKDQTRLPIPECESIRAGVFAKAKKDYQQRDQQIKDNAVETFIWSQLMVGIDHQQQGAGDRNGDYFPIESEAGTEEGFHEGMHKRSVWEVDLVPGGPEHLNQQVPITGELKTPA
jgi:hypothetical protein